MRGEKPNVCSWDALIMLKYFSFFCPSGARGQYSPKSSCQVAEQQKQSPNLPAPWTIQWASGTARGQFSSQTSDIRKLHRWLLICSQGLRLTKCGPPPTARAPPGTLLEMEMTSPIQALLNQKLWGRGSSLCFHKHSRGFSWRTSDMVERFLSLDADLNSNSQRYFFGKWLNIYRCRDVGLKAGVWWQRQRLELHYHEPRKAQGWKRWGRFLPSKLWRNTARPALRQGIQTSSLQNCDKFCGFKPPSFKYFGMAVLGNQ